MILLLLLLLLIGPATAQTLRAGWNPVAFPVARLTSLSADPAVLGALTYENGSYRSVTLTTALDTSRGYWVYARSAANLTYTGEGVLSPLALQAGWNLVAVPPGTALPGYQLNPDGSSTLTTSLTPGAPAWIYSSGAGVLVALFTHNEDPHHPSYPDFVNDKGAYRTFRSSLLEFARELRSRNLSWNWQSDWNFLNAVLKYEVEERDAELLGQTEGKNLVVYLRDSGVEIDPHSHENDGYNYADVAYLITRTGVTPAPIVGGHIYDPSESGYQNWPRFANGLRGARFPDYTFRPTMLTGAGSGSHRRDPVATGLWKPASATDFFTHSSAGALTAFGGWDGNLDRFEGLLRLSEAGALPAGPTTAAFGFNQWQIAEPGYLSGTIVPALERIKSWRDAGRIRTVKFEESLALGGGTVYPTGNDMVSFSLNTQDFAYPDRSASLVSRALDLHERLKVPVDVFLTSTQADLLPASLLERLKGSRLATVSYHFRPPAPYANNYDWAGLSRLSLDGQVAAITNYETHGLDLVTGQPTAARGGYAKLTDFFGYAPFIVGSGDPGLFPATAQVLAGMGAQLAVEHSPPVNLGEQKNGLFLRPEHVDLRLFESGYANQGGQTVLEQALSQARNAGGTAPYFTGVKMHDNDFFAVDSAWVTVYQTGGRRNPPWDTSRKAALLSDAEQAEMWSRYESLVTYAASVRSRVNLVNGPVIRALEPSR